MPGAIRNSFKRRLLITGTILGLLVFLATAAIFLAARQYNFYLERSSRAQQVYATYLAVSDHIYRKLTAMGQIVEEGTLVNIEARYRNQKSLRASLKQVREGIVAELTHVGDVKEAEELEHFNKIEIIAEEIIRGSALVIESVTNQDEPVAEAALAKLRSPAVEGAFTQLIDEALSEELREVRETQRVTKELSTLLTRLLPILFTFFVICGVLLLYATWRALTRSLKIFEQAVTSYQNGDFDYKIPNDVEGEFADLASALNQMAFEVSSQRERERVTQENLESMIDNRTRELKTTNEKIELISETRKQFLADISHELRTPLTIIRGEADIALRGEPKTPEQYREALTRVREQTIHTTRLVQDLLFVARTEDGKAPLHKRAESVVPLITEICSEFDVIASEKSIDIKLFSPEYDLVIGVDSGRFKQVISILLDNAVRYSYAGSTINVNVLDAQKYLSIEICDSGIGLEDNDASQIFSRFYRGGDGADKASGTGLGLPVAKAIVDAHGGTISLQGEQGRGTTATITFPLEKQIRDVS